MSQAEFRCVMVWCVRSGHGSARWSLVRWAIGVIWSAFAWQGMVGFGLVGRSWAWPDMVVLGEDRACTMIRLFMPFVVSRKIGPVRFVRIAEPLNGKIPLFVDDVQSVCSDAICSADIKAGPATASKLHSGSSQRSTVFRLRCISRNGMTGAEIIWR